MPVPDQNRGGPEFSLPVLLLFFLGLVAAVHSPSLSGGFVWDDFSLIADHPRVSELSFQNIRRVFTSAFFSNPFHPGDTDAPQTAYFRPGATMGYMMLHALFQGRPFGFHLANIVVHALNAFLVFLVMTRIGLIRSSSLVVAILFALHPGSHQAVDYATGLTDLLAVFFALLSLSFLFSWFQSDRFLEGAAAFLFYFVSMLCKETTYLLPLLGAVPFLFRNSLPPPTAIRKLLFFSLPLLFVLLWRQTVSETSLLAPESMSRSADYYAGVFSGLGRNVGRYFFPFSPGFMQQYRALPHWSAPHWTLALFAVLLLFAGGIYFRAAKFFAALLWFVTGWIPVSNLVPMHPAISGFALYESDHLFYFAGIGLCMGTVIAARALLGNKTATGFSRRQTLLCALLILVLVSWTIRAFQNSRVWGDAETLYRTVCRTQPANPGGWLNLAVHYLRKNDARSALRTLHDFEKRLGPPRNADPGLYSQFSTNLAACYVRLGDWKNAAVSYRRAVDAMPENFLAWHGLGVVYSKTGNLVQASRSLSKALEIRPEFVPSRRLLDSLPVGERNKENNRTSRDGTGVPPRAPGNPPGTAANDH